MRYRLALAALLLPLAAASCRQSRPAMAIRVMHHAGYPGAYPQPDCRLSRLCLL